MPALAGLSRLFVVLAAVSAACLWWPAAYAQAPPPWLKAWTPPVVPSGYRSPGEPHKLLETTAQRRTTVAESLATFDYQRKRLHLVTTAELERLDAGAGIRLRDDFNLIRLRDRFFDTTVEAPAVPAQLARRNEPGARLHLVQFSGPVQGDWLAFLSGIETLQVVSYMPSNAYLVWVGAAATETLAQAVTVQPFLQWEGPFHPDYVLHPGLDLDFSGALQVTVQLFTHAETADSVAAVTARSSRVIKAAQRVGVFTNIAIETTAADIVAFAQRRDVVNIEPYLVPSLGGERQAVALRGGSAVTASGALFGPGYLAWLNGLGFGTTFDFAVDVADSGLDRGETVPPNLHPDLLDALGNSRVAYVQRVAGSTIDTTAAANNDVVGHGTAIASIIGGFNDTVGASDEDADGFQYGLGIAPFVRLGSSKIWDGSSIADFTHPNFSELVSAAYDKGARIGSNSWSSKTTTQPLNEYDVVSQEYDLLVRDARPSTVADGGLPGNQEMPIVFLSGNQALVAALWSNGSTAKNTLVSGATEGFNQVGQTVCAVPDSRADDVRDVWNLSARGPVNDQRVKPDLVAPGTHIAFAASQDPAYAGPCTSTPHFPTAQTLYALGSGTSFAAPAVAGAAALLRQWFIDNGHPPPSPAMTKAYLMNASEYLTGANAGDDLPSVTQGMGRVSLERAFDSTPRLLFDQIKTAHNTAAIDAGEVFSASGSVADPTQPFRVTMAYTDAAALPGAGPDLENDLDLQLEIGGNTYRGNNFTGQVSDTGGIADSINNVESVWLPTGQSGNFTVTVTPTSIGSDGVPNNGDATDQDFALVVYNGNFPSRDPVDIILVLDASGSMSNTASGGASAKVDLLRDAVELFIRTWEPFAIATDRMGMVFFSDDIVATDPGTAPLLKPFAANANAFIESVRSQPPSGCTALGAGILTAVRGFDPGSTADRHIIVFTNGMQNRSPMVQAVSPTAHQIVNDQSASCGSSNVAPEAGVNIADYAVKAIHTIGTGASGAAWTDLLSDIAAQTGGDSHFTTTPDENLEDFFLDDLVEALRVDPVERVARRAGSVAAAASSVESFEIDTMTRQATFVLSWRGPAPLHFDLIAPEGTAVPGHAMELSTGEFYRIATVRLPLQADGVAPSHGGTWRMAIRSPRRVAPVRYRAHVIIDNADIRYHFDAPTSGLGVGEPLPLALAVQDETRTRADLRFVRATIKRPPLGFGTFLATTPISADQLARPVEMAGDRFGNLASKKAFLLLGNEQLREQLVPLADSIELVDDGNPAHGDARGADGVYSAIYTATTRPGIYSIDLDFEMPDGEGGIVSRSLQRDIRIGLERFDAGRSVFSIVPVRDAEGVTLYQTRVTLIDRFGNYLGPGHAVHAVIAAGKWGGRRVMLDDNLDGSYSANIRLTPAEIEAGSTLRIDVGGRIVASAPVRAAARLAWSLHLGLTQPVGSTPAAYDTGHAVEIDLTRRLSPDDSIEAVLGYYDFDDRHIVGAAARWRRAIQTASPWYLSAGLGAYKPQRISLAPGLSVGIGLDRRLGARLDGDLALRYFHLFTSGPDPAFVTVTFGLRYSW